MNVKFAGRKCLGIIFGLNKNGRYHTVLVLLDNEEYEVFTVYDEVVADLNKKYHYMDSQTEDFKSPYEKGDKYQHGVTALKVHKLDLKTYWLFPAGDPSSTDDDNSIDVVATDGCNVRIRYQSGAMINQVIEDNSRENSKDY
mgnify:CR=1 FL=1